jgi:tetratricopeptide (TPR) repeat protein
MKDYCYIRVSDFQISPSESFYQSSLAETIDFTGFIYATKPRGTVRYTLVDKKGAIADYSEAIRINPNSALSYYNRGIARSDLGDKKGAIADFDQAIRLNPNFADIYNNRGIARAALGDKKGAIADFDQVIRLNPNFAIAYFNRGKPRYELGDQQGAIADLQKAAELYQTQGDQVGYQKVTEILSQIGR